MEQTVYPSRVRSIILQTYLARIKNQRLVQLSTLYTQLFEAKRPPTPNLVCPSVCKGCPKLLARSRLLFFDTLYVFISHIKFRRSSYSFLFLILYLYYITGLMEILYSETRWVSIAARLCLNWNELLKISEEEEMGSALSKSRPLHYSCYEVNTYTEFIIKGVQRGGGRSFAPAPFGTFC